MRRGYMTGYDVQEDGTLSISLDYYIDHNPDTGCGVSASCLSCPLPQCKHDDPAGYRWDRRRREDVAKLSEMERDALTVEEAAERFEIGVRTVFRIMQRGREEG